MRSDLEPKEGILSVPVLYIGGFQRSGSTLLDRMMGQVEGHISAGEVVHLWARGVRDNELCGCGERFRSCPFWSDVGLTAFEGWDRVDLDALVALQGRVDRNRYIPFMLLPGLNPRYGRDLRAYVQALDRLYRAIHVSGAGVVVDSSKHASTAFLLRRLPSVRLRVVHLIRDSRGVAFSMTRRVQRPEVVDRVAYMHRRPAWRASVEWMFINVLFHALRAAGTVVHRVRYEDLVRDPRSVLARLSALHRRTAAPDLGFAAGPGISLVTDHTVAGNPMRFEHGRIDVSVDERWREAMLRSDRRIATLLTAPLLTMYGYRLRGRPTPHDPGSRPGSGR